MWPGLSGSTFFTKVSLKVLATSGMCLLCTSKWPSPVIQGCFKASDALNLWNIAEREALLWKSKDRWRKKVILFPLLSLLCHSSALLDLPSLCTLSLTLIHLHLLLSPSPLSPFQHMSPTRTSRPLSPIHPLLPRPQLCISLLSSSPSPLAPSSPPNHVHHTSSNLLPATPLLLLPPLLLFLRFECIWLQYVAEEVLDSRTPPHTHHPSSYPRSLLDLYVTPPLLTSPLLFFNISPLTF